MLSSCQDFFCQYFKITFNTEYVKFLIDLFQISFIIRHTILSVCVCVCLFHKQIERADHKKFDMHAVESMSLWA